MKYENSALKKAITLAFSKTKPLVYQRATVSDGCLRPFGSSALKYAEIAGAAKFLEKDFTFADYGCSNGLFSFLLNQDFPGVSGRLINTDKKEIETCKAVISLLGAKNLRAVEADMFDCEEKADLTLYMSIIPHVLSGKRDPREVVDRVVKQTGALAVVEGLIEVTDVLTGRRHDEADIRMASFVETLKMRMKLISIATLKYTDSVTRVCYIFKK